MLKYLVKITMPRMPLTFQKMHLFEFFKYKNQVQKQGILATTLQLIIFTYLNY
jgi:hypothetical protein